MDVQLPLANHSCAFCQKQISHAYTCRDCQDTFCENQNTAPNTSYCSTRCRKKGWPNHSLTCMRIQTRRQLFRAASLLQEMIYVFLESMWRSESISFKKKANGKLYIIAGQCQARARAVTHLDWLAPFPNHLCKNEQMKQSVLSYMNCDYAIAFLHDAMKYLLADVTDKNGIEEITVVIGGKAKQDIMDVYDDGYEREPYNFDHEIWRVTLKHSRDVYGVDLTAAQYGWHEEPVLLMDQYADERCEYIYNVSRSQYFGGRRDYHQNRGMRGPLHEASRCFLVALKTWEWKYKTRLSAMLQLPEREFFEAREGIVREMKMGLDKYKVALGKCLVDEECPEYDPKTREEEIPFPYRQRWPQHFRRQDRGRHRARSRTERCKHSRTQRSNVE